MATAMKFLVNYVDADVNYATTPADYIEVDLINDYIIHTAGDAIVKDLMTNEPTVDELNAAAPIISDDEDTIIALMLLMDYSHNVGGSYYTHLIKGCGGENKRFVFCFAFDDVTATIPRLEAWDDSDHDSIDKNVLGAGTPEDSMVKVVKTTDGLPGAEWAGVTIAGADNYLELDNAALSGAKDLYCNFKIVIPQAYATPSAETFVTCVRYTYL